ncbi:hypothetical protein ZWY2020_007972 [Hordeum vulgare]|nr:hypothetical protein ZWY2020_007972 [Hordeum vulgare]
MTTPYDVRMCRVGVGAAAAQPATESNTPTLGLNRRGSRSAAMPALSMEVFDNEVVSSSLSNIAPTLRVAAEIEPERPRVAYLSDLHHILLYYYSYMKHHLSI